MADLRRALRKRRAAELTVEPLVDVVSEFATVVADAVNKNYNLNNSRAEKHLREYMTERVGMINTTTREALQKALQADDPREAVRDVFRRARESRARQIAVTEVVRSSNFAAIDAGKWVAELSAKSWRTQRDPQVRHTHHEMEGQIVPWNDPFVAPNGSKAQWPGGFSEPSLSIGCRCAALPAKIGQRRDLGDFGDPVELYESLRSPYVDQLEKAWVRVFDEQEREILGALG